MKNTVTINMDFAATLINYLTDLKMIRNDNQALAYAKALMAAAEKECCNGGTFHSSDCPKVR